MYVMTMMTAIKIIANLFISIPPYLEK